MCHASQISIPYLGVGLKIVAQDDRETLTHCTPSRSNFNLSSTFMHTCCSAHRHWAGKQPGGQRLAANESPTRDLWRRFGKGSLLSGTALKEIQKEASLPDLLKCKLRENWVLVKTPTGLPRLTVTSGPSAGLLSLRDSPGTGLRSRSRSQ